jgi:hypothetical protein
VDAKYDFILDDWHNWPRNIILDEVVDYIKEVKRERDAKGQGFALHKYIHHGLSSQAMLFNLIGPLIVREDLSLLDAALGGEGLVWPEGCINALLEFEDRAVFNEDAGQPTSMDLVLTNADDQPFVFIEYKFSEEGFGGCSVFGTGDCDGRNPACDFSLCYLHHVGRRYWELMEKYGFLDGPVKDERLCVMASHYQFFRIVLFALAYGRPCVLLSDARSPSFDNRGLDGQQRQRGRMPMLLDFVPEVARSQVVAVTIQDVVAAIKAGGGHEWVGQFEEKYGLV